MCANQVGGNVEIGSSLTRTGAVEIAKNTRGDVNIASNMTVVGTNLINVGTASIGTLSLRGANANINTTGTGAISLGNTTGTLTLNQSITPAYTYPAASGTPTVIAGTGAGKVGEVKYNIVKIVSTISTGSLPQPVANIAVSAGGVYLLNFSGQFYGPTATTQAYFGLSVTGTTDAGLYTGNIGFAPIISSPAPYYYGVNGCWIVQPVGAGTYIVSCTGLAPANITIDYVNIKVVRIA